MGIMNDMKPRTSSHLLAIILLVTAVAGFLKFQ
jgi:hypothetical protein